MQRPPSIEDSNSIGQMNGQATGRSLVQPLPGSHSGSIPGPHPGSYQNPHPGSHVPPSSHIPPHSSLQGSHNMPLPNQLPPTHQGPIQSGHNSMALPHSSPHPQPSGIPAPLSHGGQNRAPPTAYPSTHPVHAMKESNPNLSHNVPHIETGYNIQNQNIGQHSSNSPQTNGAQNPPMPTRGGSIDMIDPMRQEHSSYEVEFQKLKLEKSEFQSKCKYHQL